MPLGYQHTDFRRDYYFLISFGFGGKEDLDVDVDDLPGKWELAYFNSLGTLSGIADTDHDGTTDAVELEAGTDPTDAEGSTPERNRPWNALLAPPLG